MSMKTLYKKDYIKIANRLNKVWIKEVTTPQEREIFLETVLQLADLFKSENNKFNKILFCNTVYKLECKI